MKCFPKITIIVFLTICFAIVQSCQKPTAPTVSTASVSGITQTTATAGGNVTSDGNNEVNARGVCWDASQNPTTSSSKTSDGKGSGTFCWYNNDAASYRNVYGALYNWYAVNDSRKLCPAGWHEPSDAEWGTLITYLGGSNIAGGKLKETGTTHWIDPNQGVTNSSGFTALPGGTRYGVITDPQSYYVDIGRNTYFWSTTEYSDPIYGFYGANSINISWGGEACYNQAFIKSQGASVRCIKD